MTALKTRAAPQFEVLLKLKQSCNEEFAFLQPGNELNLYYLWLKDRDVSVVNNVSSPTHDLTRGPSAASCINLVDYASSTSSTSTRKERGDSSKENNTMGAILGMYSSSSGTDESSNDDECCESTSPSTDKDDKNSNSHELTLIKSSKRKADLTIEMEKIDTNTNADCNEETNSQVQHASTTCFSNIEMTKMNEQQQTGQQIMTKSDNALNAEQKARRLKRAKIMKGHFVLKMMDSK